MCQATVCRHLFVLKYTSSEHAPKIQLAYVSDVDECATGRVSCPRFRQCVNTFGSYICKCHKGFDLMYIGGKYQCHGKEPQSRLFPVSSSGLLIVLKTDLLGVGDGGGGGGGSGTKQTGVQFNPQYFGIHRQLISLVYLPVLYGPSHCRKLFLKLSIYSHAILFISPINISFPYFMMQI